MLTKNPKTKFVNLNSFYLELTLSVRTFFKYLSLCQRHSLTSINTTLKHARNCFQIWGWIFLLIVLTSVAIQCVSTHPISRVRIEPDDTMATNTNNTLTDDNHNYEGYTFKADLYLNSTLRPSLRYTQRLCLATFALEHSLRFMTCPSKLQFMKSAFNVIDVVTFVPMLALEVIASLYYNRLSNEVVFRIAFLFSLMGVLKIVRIVKFTLQYGIMRVLILSLKASAPQISLLLVLISIGMLLFSTLIYYAEFYTDNFESIPIGYWWAIVTMTTVGYGDTHPITGWGYVIGSLCAVAGMISTGLPLPVIANNFNFYYKYARVYAFKQRRLQLLKAARCNYSVGAGGGSSKDADGGNHEPDTCVTRL